MRFELPSMAEERLRKMCSISGLDSITVISSALAVYELLLREELVGGKAGVMLANGEFQEVTICPKSRGQE